MRYCPICDGYEVTDKRIAILGGSERSAKEALFLRSYSADVTLIATQTVEEMSPDCARTLAAANIRQVSGPLDVITLDGKHIVFGTPMETLRFDTLYPALGKETCSQLAIVLGAKTTQDGGLTVDARQRTSLCGLYAAGDVVHGLDQISHAMGEGGVAATTVRNDLERAARSWRRPIAVEPHR